jgi:NAD(P)-dependent dehydrogenase (short-subunit alcohol dehydrogenase family)
MSAMGSNPFSLESKRILVTGASSGIGKATAILLSELGAKIVACGRDESRLKECCAALSGDGHEWTTLDLSDTDRIDPWMDGIVARGQLDGLVHCAGLLSTLPVKSVTEKTYSDMMDVNVKAGFFLAKSFRRKNVHTKPASIVFVSSISAIAGLSSLSVYGCGKAALLGLSKSLAIEFSTDAIRVNCVVPGLVRSQMSDQMYRAYTKEQMQAISERYPLGLGLPEDVACAIAYLSSDASRWITGSSLVIDGGYSAQ